MKIQSCWLKLCLVLTTVSIVPCVVRADGPQWIEVRSPHFSVITDAGEKRGREVAMRFEQMRSVFATLLTKANVNIPVPLQIVAFRNTKEFRQFAPLWHGKPTELAGLFQGGEDRSFILLDMSVDNPYPVVFHEYGHQLMNGNLSQEADAWFEEGFAEYFSSIEVDNKEAHVGKIPDQTYLTLQQGGWMKVGDLFRVRHNTATYNETGERRTVFYAESSMVVHYLFDNQLVPKLGNYFQLKTKNVAVEDAIQQAFGMDAMHFDKALRDYVAVGRYRYYSLPTPSDIVSSAYTIAPVSAADTNALMADIHFHSPDYRDKAVEEFQAVLKTDANNAAACRGLGYAYMRKNQFSEAAEYFQRAAQLNSRDPRVHYYSAMLMNTQGGFADKSKLQEMIKELETAIALDPNFADPYSLLGFAQGFNGDMEHGLANLQKAIALSPRNEWYRFNLAQMYLNGRKPDEAIAQLQLLTHSSDQQIAMRATESLARAQQMKEFLSSGVPMRDQIQIRRVDDDDEDSEPAKPANAAKTSNPAPVREPMPSGPVKFIKGVLTGMDCSSPPAAVLTVVSGTTSWKMRVPDTSHVILLGEDKFSCSWSKRKVALNFVEASAGEGRVISLELQ